MIVLAGLVIGAIWGALLAKKRGGRGLDVAHYAAGFGVAFMILGLVITIVLDKMLAV